MTVPRRRRWGVGEGMGKEEGRGGGPGATWKSIRHDEDVETTPHPFVLRQAFKL